MTTTDYSRFPRQKPCRTKIVATLGPASDSEEKMKELIQAGVDLFRLNCAHKSLRENEEIIRRIRKVSQEQGQPIAILADLAGPKMRLGELPNGSYFCQNGATVRFVRGQTSSQPETLTTSYEPLLDDLKIGDRVLLADGTVTLQVVGKKMDASSQNRMLDEVECRVLQAGVVRSRQGINLPGVQLSIPTLQPNDIENATEAVRLGIDFLGLSFVRSPQDILDLRDILIQAAEKNVGSEFWNDLIPEDRSLYYPNIIAKIEKQEALPLLDDIIQIADGIMIARGDLGVEVDIARIAVLQKQMIEACRYWTKPVIVATQMLESMIEETIPTRAEATDVANAILDGADACMLSAETAIGKHPVEAVDMMNRIARETETILEKRSLIEKDCRIQTMNIMNNLTLPEAVRVSIAVCDAAGQLADTVSASMIFVATQTGRTALNLSKMRNFVMTVGTSSSLTVLRRLCLYWGVIPVGNVPSDPSQMLTTLVERAQEGDYLSPNDLVILVSGIGTISNNQNVIYAHKVS